MHADRLADFLAATCDDIEDAGGNAGLMGKFGDTQCRQRCFRSWLDDDRAAGGKCRTDLPCQHQQREVPGQDAADDAHRFAHDHGKRVDADRGRIVIELVDHLGMPANGMDRIGNVDRLALADRLAAVDAFHDRQFVPVALEQLGEFQQDFLALRRCGDANGRLQRLPAPWRLRSRHRLHHTPRYRRVFRRWPGWSR